MLIHRYLDNSYIESFCSVQLLSADFQLLCVKELWKRNNDSSFCPFSVRTQLNCGLLHRSKPPTALIIYISKIYHDEYYSNWLGRMRFYGLYNVITLWSGEHFTHDMTTVKLKWKKKFARLCISLMDEMTNHEMCLFLFLFLFHIFYPKPKSKPKPMLSLWCFCSPFSRSRNSLRLSEYAAWGKIFLTTR